LEGDAGCRVETLGKPVGLGALREKKKGRAGVPFLWYAHTARRGGEGQYRETGSSLAAAWGRGRRHGKGTGSSEKHREVPPRLDVKKWAVTGLLKINRAVRQSFKKRTGEKSFQRIQQRQAE